ncbi:transposase family protein [Acutalibacter muris]|uniref:transposase family protein n=1 Tax=Acutalibacter muris TaxID=1796620 RepID=UPI00272A2072|nr:transposase family protein [Acutalibacter muris]
MKYEKLAEYSNTRFRRITGVKRATFDKRVEILRKGYAEKPRRRGRTPKLSIEDLLLATLEYLREHRTYTYAHITASYGIAESNIYRGSKCANSLLPKKRSKNPPLSKQEHKDNRKISKKSIFIEHAICFVKRFRILSERYRNRRHRFALRFSLIAGICNFDRFA